MTISPQVINLIKINTYFFCLKPFTTNLALYCVNVELASYLTLKIHLISKTFLPKVVKLDSFHKLGWVW